jgi:hypothetical protein
MDTSKTVSEPVLVWLKRDPQKRWLLWWRPEGSGTYYPINYNNVIRDILFEPSKFRFLMNRLIQGETMMVHAVYDRTAKRLVIHKLVG